MPKTVILGSARTPIGKLGGGLSSLDATELGATSYVATEDPESLKPLRNTFDLIARLIAFPPTSGSSLVMPAQHRGPV